MAGSSDGPDRGDGKDAPLAAHGGGGTDAITHPVTAAESGQRLDLVLATALGASRSQVQRWIGGGHVLVDGRPGKAKLRVSAGMVIEVRPPAAEPTDVVPEAIPLAILFEDEHLIVIDKPAGMVVHPAPGHYSGTLVNALLDHCRDLAGIGGELRPGIVHRLDQGTSGVMVVAKNDAAHADLSAQFHDHTIERVYLAIVRARAGAEEGRIERVIGRHRTDRKRMSVRTREGRPAVTAWRVLERFPRSDMTLLEVRPETGRTHQIRVHLSAAGLPIAGDPVYGRATPGKLRTGEPALDRPALHAAVLGFTHPSSRERLRFEAPLPDDLTALLDWLRRREEDGG